MERTVNADEHPAVPRMNTDDDIYNGYFIPAGSTIIVNSWAVAHDSARYGPHPENI